MGVTFDFDLSKCFIKIDIAMHVEPKNLKNSFPGRHRNSFLYILSGKYKYYYSNDSFIATKGHLIYLPKTSEPYSFEIFNTSNEITRYLQVEFNVISSETGEKLSFAKHPTLIDNVSTIDVEECMKNLVKVYPSTQPYARHTAISELLKILSLVSEKNYNPVKSSAEKSIYPAIKYIEEHYAEKISSNELAKLCHLSESQLRRNFQTALNLSPNAYKQELVLKMAKKLLKIDEFNVGEIAEMLGFYDIYAFSHFFTKAEGVSPILYRKKVISK